MDWREVHKQLLPKLERSANIYKHLGFGTLLMALIFLVVFPLLGVVLFTLAVIFYFSFQKLSRGLPYVLDGICLKKEKFEYIASSHSDMQHTPAVTLVYIITFQAQESFQLSRDGKGKLLPGNMTIFTSLNVSQSVYQCCQEKKIISFIVTPDSEMMGFITDGTLAKFHTPLPLKSNRNASYAFLGDAWRSVEMVEFK